MKKLLVSALLFTGISLGFAKDYSISKSIEIEKGSSVTCLPVNSSLIANFDLKKLCSLWYQWETTEIRYDMYGNSYDVTILHTRQYQYWCGENEPRVTFMEGTPP